MRRRGFSPACLLVAVTFGALLASAAMAQENEFDEETGLYIVCVKQLMLDGGLAYRKQYGRIASARNLVISAIELCQRQRLAAAASIMEDDSAASLREGQQALDEVLNPHFMAFARGLNLTLRKVR